MSYAWVPVPDVQRFRFTPVGLRLVDDFTGTAPDGPLAVELEAKDGPTTWRTVEHRATFTPSGWIAFFGLGRTVSPLGKPIVRHRARVRAATVLPLYGLYPSYEHIEFDVFPYDDLHPPSAATSTKDVFMLPATAYTYPAEIRVVRGRVVDAGGHPVARALVKHVHLERVMTDDRGEFALPLRWVATGTVVQIDAVDAAGRVGSLPVAIPDDLTQAQQITIT